jgi:hypothetical protein
MLRALPLCAAFIAGVLASMPGQALAQAPTDSDSVRLILVTPRAGVPFRQAVGDGPYNALRAIAGAARVETLPMTKGEAWALPKARAEAVRAAAVNARIVVHQLGENWMLFAPRPASAPMSDEQRAIVDQARASQATVGVKMMAAPAAPIVEYAMLSNQPASGAPMIVELDQGKSVSVTPTQIDRQPDMAILRGTVDGTGAPATLMWWPDGKMVGMMQHEGRIYSFRHMGGETMAMVEMSEARMPREHAPMSQRLRANDPNLRDDPLVQEGDSAALRPRVATAAAPRSGIPKPKSATGKDIVIDVIVAYTRAVAAHYGDVKRELVSLAIEEGNESFRMSNLRHVKLRLVHAYQTDYVEQGEHFDHVWRFADKGDGYMEEIHGLRDKYRADVAILIVDDAKGCGLATRVYADADEAFAVVHHECAAATYSVAHEIGHLIGARHDRNLDKSTLPFPYGHGYVSAKWRDIMSYKESCGGCPRLPVWSSPLITIKGEPAGAPDMDNARVIAEQAARVADFR